MTITLSGHTYAAVLDMDGNRLVIVLRGKMWRVASAQDTLRVLRGFGVCPLRLV